MHAFHLLYTTKSRDTSRWQTASFQQINHFEGTKSLTTKVGLTHNMKNLVWQHFMDINDVFPQSYDLTDPSSEEFKDFLQEFKFGQLIAFLKSALLMPAASFGKGGMMDKAITCMAFVERRCKMMSDQVLDPNQTLIVAGQNNELDQISDDVYYTMIESKQGYQEDFSRQPWFMKFIKTSELVKEIDSKNVKQRIKFVLKQLMEVIGTH